MNKRKEVYSFVPQEIARHFIELDTRQQVQPNEAVAVTIRLNQEVQSSAADQDEEAIYEYHSEDNGYDCDYDDAHVTSDSTLCNSSIQENDHDNEQEQVEETSHAQKWSFMRGLFSKLRLYSIHPPSLTSSQELVGDDASPYLSTYGTLINKRIGEGVSATVQLTQRQDDALFAVKIFRKRKKRESLTGYMKALAGEFCIASTLNHRNVIKTLDFVRMDNNHERYCIIMEFVSFKTVPYAI